MFDVPSIYIPNEIYPLRKNSGQQITNYSSNEEGISQKGQKEKEKKESLNYNPQTDGRIGKRKTTKTGKLIT